MSSTMSKPCLTPSMRKSRSSSSTASSSHAATLREGLKGTLSQPRAGAAPDSGVSRGVLDAAADEAAPV